MKKEINIYKVIEWQPEYKEWIIRGFQGSEKEIKKFLAQTRKDFPGRKFDYVWIGTEEEE